MSIVEMVVDRREARSVAAARVGAMAGSLVVYLHGAPSSRLDIAAMDASSAARGVVVAAPDRPGYGASDYHAYTFTSVADDVVAVADALGADHFWVVGQSAGAPYALATAARHPDRVRAACMSGGHAPFFPAAPWWADLSAEEQRGVTLIGVDDQEASRLLAEADRPFVDALALDDAGLLAFWRALCQPADQQLLDTSFGPQVFVPTLRESLRQGQAGWARDNVVRMGAWDIDLDAVSCPVLAWYGEQDHHEHGAWLADHLSTATLHVQPDAGHFSLLTSWDAVLDMLGVPRA